MVKLYYPQIDTLEINKNDVFELTDEDIQAINLLKNNIIATCGFEPTIQQTIKHSLKLALNSINKSIPLSFDPRV